MTNKRPASKQYARSTSRQDMLALEPRILLDASVLATSDAVADAPDLADAVSTPGPEPLLDAASASLLDLTRDHTPPAVGAVTQVLFVDPRVRDSQSLTSQLRDGVLLVELDAGRDGVEQVTAVLEDYSDLQAIHLLTHGDDATLLLGGTVLNLDNVEGYSDSLTSWRESLSADADILIYGCDVAAGDDGQALVNRLAELTGADVAASTDSTGADGDWALETTTGDIETEQLFDTAVTASYAGNLATVTWDGESEGPYWHDDFNWSDDTLPGIGDDVVIDGFSVTLEAAETETIINSLTLLNGAQLNILEGGELTVNGATNVDPSSSIDNTGGTLSLLGASIVDGQLTLTYGSYINVYGPITSSGVFQGNGEIRFYDATDFDLGGSSINPGTSPGTLGLVGDGIDVDLTGFTLNIELHEDFDGDQSGYGGAAFEPGDDYDQLQSPGTSGIGAYLLGTGSTLTATLSPGYTPGVGDTFTIIDTSAMTETPSGTVTGTFDTLNLPDLSAQGLIWDVGYTTDKVLLTVVPNAPPVATPSVLDQVLALDGVDDYASIAADPALGPTTEITLEAWINPDNLTGTNGIAGTWNDIGADERSYFMFLRNGELSFYVSSTGGPTPGTDWQFVKATGITLNTGQWYHVAGTFDGTQVKIYVDGVLRGTQAFAGVINDNGRPLTIGRTDTEGNAPDYFDGRIGDVRLWDAALTQAQIQANLNRIDPIDTNDLVGHWDFEETSGNAVHDRSGNGLNGALMNGATRMLSERALWDLDEAQTGNLLRNPSFNTGESTDDGHPIAFAEDWTGDLSVIVSAENGIVPDEGGAMLRIDGTASFGAWSSTAGEVWQLIDMAPYATEIATGKATLSAAALFNRVLGDSETDTRFTLTVTAYGGDPANFPSDWWNNELGLIDSISISSDGDLGTWEGIENDFLISTGTTYLAVRVSALENIVNDSVAPEFDGHYVDNASAVLNTVIPGVTVLEDQQRTLVLGGSDPDSDTLTVTIDLLPGNGTLYQTSDGSTLGSAITAVGTAVTDTQMRVIYKPGTDYNGPDSVDYELTDGNGGSTVATIPIEVVDTLPYGIALDNDTVPENSANGTLVGTLSLQDDDDATATFSIQSDSTGGAFGLQGTDNKELVVADGSLLDFENSATATLEIRGVDDDGNSFDEMLTVNIQDLVETNTYLGPADPVEADLNNPASWSEGRVPAVGDDIVSDRDIRFNSADSYDFPLEFNAITITDGADLVLSGNTGFVVKADTLSMTGLPGNAALLNGGATLDLGGTGTAYMHDAAFSLEGVLDGNLVMTGDTSNNSILNLRNFTGLNVTGNVSMDPNANVFLYPNDTGGGFLSADGDIALDGELNVYLRSGYEPSAGDTFDLITAGGSLTGAFHTVRFSVDNVLGELGLKPVVSTLGNVVQVEFVANTAPDAVDDTVDVTEDSSVFVDVLDNDTDAENDPLTLIAPTPANLDALGDAAYTLAITGNTNTPTMVLTNDSASAEIVSLQFTIGNTAKNFDAIGAVSGGMTYTLNAPDTNYSGGVRSDLIDIDFTGGFTSGQSAAFIPDIDADNSDTTENYTVTFANNGAAPNSQITVTFSDGRVLTQTLPESPASWTFSQTWAPMHGTVTGGYGDLLPSNYLAYDPTGTTGVGGSASFLVQIDPPASVEVGELEWDYVAFIFREQRDHVLAADLTAIDFTAPGSHNDFSAPPGGTISTGTHVTSHFIQLDAEGEPGTEVRHTGSANFDTEILGVIVTDANLDATDALLGNPGTTYPGAVAMRGLQTGSDEITISADGKSLSFDIGVTGGIDQIRVITAASGLTYTPDADYTGADSFGYTVLDGRNRPTNLDGNYGLFNSATVNINVLPANDAPDAVDDSFSTREDVALAPTESTFDADTEGWTTTGDGGAPTHQAGGGNPDGYIQAVDGQSGSSWFWNAPAAYLGDQSDYYGQTLSYDLRQNVTGGQITFADDVLLTGAGLTLRYDAGPNPGTDWTEYSVLLTETGWIDNATGLAATEAQMQAVLGALDGLLIRGEFSTLKDTGSLDNVRIAPNLLANDTDIDAGDTLAVSDHDDTSEEGGSVMVYDDGSFSYTPPADFHGTDTFTYTVSDGSATDVATAYLVVAAENDAPTVDNPIPDQSTAEGEAFNFQFAANTFGDPDFDTPGYSAQQSGGDPLPLWLEFNAGTRTFSGTTGQALLGPTPYLSFAESPFKPLNDAGAFDWFHLEDGEDGQFNPPGVTAINNAPGTAPITVSLPNPNADSVDGDDGSIDGSGTGGHALGSSDVSSENEGFTFVFDAGVLGDLPTHAGIVWTDGGFTAPTRFEAFDADGASLGVIGPVHISDNSFAGTTAEDRFFGVVHSGGIGSILIRDPGGSNSLSFDHLQYGYAPLAGSHDIAVTADDGNGGMVSDTFALTLTNSLPTVALDNTTTSIHEDTDTGSDIKVADIVVTDDSLGTNTLSLAGDDAALFKIVGTELFLKAGTSLDFFTNPSLDVTVEVDDAGVGTDPDDTAELSIAVQTNTVIWDNDAGDGQWTTALNWSNDELPDELSDVVVNDVTGTLNLSGAAAINSLTINGETVDLDSASSLAITNFANVLSGGILNLTDASLTGAGAVEISAGSTLNSFGTSMIYSALHNESAETVNVVSGTLGLYGGGGGIGNFDKAVGSTLHFADGTFNFNGNAFTGFGDILLDPTGTDGDLVWNIGAGGISLAGANFTAQAGSGEGGNESVTINSDGSFTADFANDFELLGGSGDSASVELDIDGALDIEADTITFQGGTGEFSSVLVQNTASASGNNVDQSQTFSTFNMNLLGGSDFGTFVEIKHQGTVTGADADQSQNFNIGGHLQLTGGTWQDNPPNLFSVYRAGVGIGHYGTISGDGANQDQALFVGSLTVDGGGTTGLSSFESFIAHDGTITGDSAQQSQTFDAENDVTFAGGAGDYAHAGLKHLGQVQGDDATMRQTFLAANLNVLGGSGLSASGYVEQGSQAGLSEAPSANPDQDQRIQLGGTLRIEGGSGSGARADFDMGANAWASGTWSADQDIQAGRVLVQGGDGTDALANLYNYSNLRSPSVVDSFNSGQWIRANELDVFGGSGTNAGGQVSGYNGYSYSGYGEAGEDFSWPSLTDIDLSGTLTVMGGSQSGSTAGLDAYRMDISAGDVLVQAGTAEDALAWIESYEDDLVLNTTGDVTLQGGNTLAWDDYGAWIYAEAHTLNADIGGSLNLWASATESVWFGGDPATIIDAAGQIDLQEGTDPAARAEIQSEDIILAGGTVTGNGDLIATSWATGDQGTVSNTGATLSPGNSAGTLVIDGDYDQGAGGATSIGISGASDFDQVQVEDRYDDENGGHANLDGALNVTLDGYAPVAGDSFTILTAENGVSGTFDQPENLPALGAGLGWVVSYNANDVTLSVVSLNQAPTLTSPGAQEDQEATTITPLDMGALAADDDPGDALTFYATGLPDGLAIASGSGIISGTLNALPGTYSVEVTVDDGTDTTSVSFDWKVAIDYPVGNDLIINGSFESGAPGVGLPTTSGSWDGDYALFVGTNQGIEPLSGGQMLQSISTGDSASGNGSLNAAQVWQVIDLSTYGVEIDTGATTVDFSGYANRVAGDNETDTRSYFTIGAYSTFAGAATLNEAAALTDFIYPVLDTDADPNTWENLSRTYTVPVDTRYVALNIGWIENVFNDGTNEFDGHYWDSVSAVLNLPDNEAPAVALANTTSSLAEDASTASATKVADIVVTDDGLGANDLSLTGDDAALFEIVGSELRLIAGAVLHHETNGTLDVTVQVDDTSVGATPDDTAALAITVTDVNEAPAVALANTTTSLPEDTSTASAVKVADITVTDDALGTNTLSLTGDDAALFEIVGSELFLRAGAVLDHETNGTLDVTVQVDDAGVGATPDDTAALAITVTDVNEAPTVALANTTTSLAEDASTASATKVADIVVTDDALGTNTLSLTGDDAALFEIVGTELLLRAGTALDHETNGTLDVTVQVDDASVGATPDDTAALAIIVTDVNEAPAVALANTTTSLPENTSTASAVKVADITVTDDALGTNTLSLTGDDAALFEIVGSELFLRAGAVLDHETNGTLDVTVQVDDTTVGETPDGSAALAITVTDVNEPPTDIALANTTTSLAEDASTASATKVADITVTDDALGTNTLSLTGDDAALFEIVGSELFLRAGAALDHETNGTLDVTVQVDDTSVGATPDDTAALAITVTDVNEAPAVALANTTTSLAEDASTASATKVADIVVTDDALGTNTLSLTGDDAALFEVVGTELFLRAGAVLDHETNGTLDVTVQVDDASVGATPDDTAALAITVTDVNEAPTVALANTTTSLAEDASTASATKVADIVVTDDALGTNTLSLTGDDAALFEIVGSELFLRAGAVLDHETNGTLDVSVQVDDASVGATPDDTAALAITVTDVNEAPTDLALSNASVAENAPGAVVGTLTVTDVDLPDDTHTFTVMEGSAVSTRFEVVGGQLQLKSGVSLDHESEPSVTLDISVEDQGEESYSEQFVVSVTDVNDAPTDIALSNANISETAQAGAAVGDLTGTDPDDTVLTFSILTDTSGGAFGIGGAGNDQLVVVDSSLLDAGTSATEDVTVRVTDPNGNGYDETFSVTIEAGGQTNVFTNTLGNGDLFDPANWSLGFVPGGTDNIELPAGAGPVSLPDGFTAASLSNDGATLNITGSVNVGTYTQSGGTLALAGGSLNGSVDIQGGTLAGNGTINGDAVVDGVWTPGSSPGLHSVNGDFTLNSTSSTTLEVHTNFDADGTPLEPGQDYDHLAATGTATLGGNLQVAMLGGYVPGVGDSFNLIDSATLSGQFGNVTLPGLPGGLGWNLSYGTQTLDLSVISTVTPPLQTTTPGPAPLQATPPLQQNESTLTDTPIDDLLEEQPGADEPLEVEDVVAADPLATTVEETTAPANDADTGGDAGDQATEDTAQGQDARKTGLTEALRQQAGEFDNQVQQIRQTLLQAASALTCERR